MNKAHMIFAPHDKRLLLNFLTAPILAQSQAERLKR
jgi:hypothetical protein